MDLSPIIIQYFYTQVFTVVKRLIEGATDEKLVEFTIKVREME